MVAYDFSDVKDFMTLIIFGYIVLNFFSEDSLKDNVCVTKRIFLTNGGQKTRYNQKNCPRNATVYVRIHAIKDFLFSRIGGSYF